MRPLIYKHNLKGHYMSVNQNDYVCNCKYRIMFLRRGIHPPVLKNVVYICNCRYGIVIDHETSFGQEIK